MPSNFNWKHILLIILVIIIIIWFIKWLMNRRKGAKISEIQQSVARHEDAHRRLDQQAANQLDQQAANQLDQQAANQQYINAMQNPHSHSQADANIRKPFTLHYFHNPGCGACKKFNSTWTNLSEKLSGINNLCVSAIDTTKPENENRTFYYNITKTPTIILVTPDKHIEYNGDYSINNLFDFIMTNLHECSQ